MREFPHSPRNDPLFRTRLVWKHGDVLEQVTVRVVKEDRRGRHPRKNYGLVCRLTVEVERRDARRLQRARGYEDICEARAERRVQCHPLRA
jgi:hypothetical protein